MAESPDTTLASENPTPSLRTLLARAAQALVDVLDAIDGDPDAEDNGDAEPSLAAPNSNGGQLVLAAGGDDDREGDNDYEPSLGSVNPSLAPPLLGHSDAVGVRTSETQQLSWSHGNTNEGEGDEHDGREPGCEDEGAQCDDEGVDDDREYDPAEAGIADNGGLQEQLSRHAGNELEHAS